MSEEDTAGLGCIFCPRCAPEVDAKMAPGELAAHPFPGHLDFESFCAFPLPLAGMIAAIVRSRMLRGTDRHLGGENRVSSQG